MTSSSSETEIAAHPEASDAANPRSVEERFRALVSSIKDYAIFMLGPEGRIETWNAGAERTKGYTADEIVGQHMSRVLHAGGPRSRVAGEAARPGGARRPRGERGLAGAQGRHAVLGRRGHHRARRRLAGG